MQKQPTEMEQRSQVSIALPIKSKIPRKKVCKALANALCELEFLNLQPTSLNKGRSDIALAQLALIFRRISVGVPPARESFENLLGVLPVTAEPLRPTPIQETPK